MAVTLKVVAQYVGMSKPTVSDVLGKRGHLYSEETRQRVLKAARELGYRPNSSAKALTSGKFGCVALLVSNWHQRVYLTQGLLRGICAQLAEHDMHLTIAQLPDEQLTAEGVVPKILRQWMVDGILIEYIAGIPQRMVDLIHQYSIPSVWINSKQPADCVHPQDFEAGQQATQRLLAFGHRRICFVNFSYPREDDLADLHYSQADRQAGYEHAMRQAGLVPHVVAPTDTSHRGDLAIECLKQPNRPTGIVAYDQRGALAIQHAAAFLHLNVPQDLSIITFGDRLHDKGVIAVDTLTTPEVDLGRKAVEVLLEKIADPARPLPPCALPFGFAAGSSVIAIDAKV